MTPLARAPETSVGKASVRQVFRLQGGSVAGCFVTEGKLVRGALTRVRRNDDIVGTYKISSIQHVRTPLQEVGEQMECGVMLEGFAEFEAGDTLECFEQPAAPADEGTSAGHRGPKKPATRRAKPPEATEERASEAPAPRGSAAKLKRHQADVLSRLCDPGWHTRQPAIQELLNNPSLRTQTSEAVFDRFEQVRAFLQQHDRSYWLRHVWISQDVRVNTTGAAVLARLGLTELPFPFGDVGETLDVTGNALASWDGFPRNARAIDCSNNRLPSFKNFPTKVHELRCNDNELTSLRGLCDGLQSLHCSGNRLTSLVGLPLSCEHLECANNPLKIAHLPREEFHSLRFADCSALTSLRGLRRVNWTLDLSGCAALTSLPEGLEVGGDLRLRGCTALKKLPGKLKVGGNLDLTGCTALTSLPVDLQATALDISGCPHLCAKRDHLLAVASPVGKAITAVRGATEDESRELGGPPAGANLIVLGDGTRIFCLNGELWLKQPGPLAQAIKV